MVTLLFAVFVVLYALNLSDEATPTEDVAGSMQESFNTPMDDIPIERRVGPTEAGFGIFDHMRGNSVRPPLSKKYPGQARQVKTIEEEMNRVNMMIEDRMYGPEKYSASSDEAGQNRIVEVQRTDRGFKLRLLARHFYRSGSSRIKREATPDLDKVVKILKELGRDVTVEGHTDSIPPKGDLTNWDLSALRATHVVRYMIQRHSFPPSKISAAGYADKRPIASNGTESGRSLNRRIEMHVNYDPEYQPDPR